MWGIVAVSSVSGGNGAGTDLHPDHREVLKALLSLLGHPSSVASELFGGTLEIRNCIVFCFPSFSSMAS